MCQILLSGLTDGPVVEELVDDRGAESQPGAMQVRFNDMDLQKIVKIWAKHTAFRFLAC
jgi:hypothetical protein